MLCIFLRLLVSWLYDMVARLAVAFIDALFIRHQASYLHLLHFLFSFLFRVVLPVYVHFREFGLLGDFIEVLDEVFQIGGERIYFICSLEFFVGLDSPDYFLHFVDRFLRGQGCVSRVNSKFATVEVAIGFLRVEFTHTLITARVFAEVFVVWDHGVLVVVLALQQLVPVKILIAYRASQLHANNPQFFENVLPENFPIRFEKCQKFHKHKSFAGRVSEIGAPSEVNLHLRLAAHAQKLIVPIIIKQFSARAAILNPLVQLTHDILSLLTRNLLKLIM